MYYDFTFENLDLRINMYYEILGNGKEIILLHGWESPNTLYDLAKELSSSHKVYYIHIPGFGKSNNINYPLSISMQSLILKEFIKNMKLRKPHILGHSYGGRIAIEYASNSTNINKLILVDSAGIKNRSIKIFIKERIYKIYKLFKKSIDKYGSSDYVNATTMKKVMLIKAVKYDQKKCLNNIKAKTLIIYGLQDNTIPFSHAKTMNKKIRNSTLALIEGAGHFPFIDKKEEFNSILFSYLGDEVC